MPDAGWCQENCVPYISMPEGGGFTAQNDKYPANRDRLEFLFVRHNVKTVVAGHDHFYQRKTVENIRHVITCGGCAPFYAMAAKAVLSLY